jgi:RNA polymerase sigma factor (sigma-70 family)
VLALDEALNRLARLDPRQERIVELRYFSGLTVDDTAETLGISPATVKREWSMARAWLSREIRDEGASGAGVDQG